MTPFTILSEAIQQQLETLTLFANVVLIQEDKGDVPTQIEKKLGSVGMGVLLGTPEFANDDVLAPLVNARIKVQLLFMEVPAIWRKTGNEPHCADLAQAGGAALQQLNVNGFQPLRVLFGGPVEPPKEASAVQLYRLEIETMQIFGAG